MALNHERRPPICLYGHILNPWGPEVNFRVSILARATSKILQRYVARY